MCLLDEAVSTAIDNALTCRTREPRFRVFRNGMMDYKSCVRVANAWVPGLGFPHEQLREILGEGAVLAVNQLASWSHYVRDACRTFSTFVEALPPLGEIEVVDTYSFVSSSAVETPFGAHIDFEDSIILDLKGAGRRVYTWPVGSSYGEILPGSLTHFGTSFRWREFETASTCSYIFPGESLVIPAWKPHVFESLGAGFFFGISSKESTGAGKSFSIADLVGGYSFFPFNDDLYVESLIDSLDAGYVIDNFSHLSIVGDRFAYFSGRKVSLSEGEMDVLKFFPEVPLTISLFLKLIKLGVFQDVLL